MIILLGKDFKNESFKNPVIKTQEMLKKESN